MKKTIKGIMVIVLLIGCFGFYDIIKAISVSNVPDSYLFDASYGFTPHFINGVTQAQMFGMTDYAEDAWQWNSQTGTADNWNNPSRHSVRITSSSQKGNVGVLYKNVGQYNGRVVDLKLTLEDWDYVRQGGTMNGRPTYPTICFYDNNILAQPQGYAFKGLKFSFRFYEHNTSNPMTVKLHNTFKDMDGTEYMVLNEGQGIHGIYLTNNSELRSLGNKIYIPTNAGSENEDKENWTTILGETSYFSFTYGRQNNDDYDMTSKLGSRNFYWWLFSGQSVARFDTPPLSEQVNYKSAETIHNSDAFTYQSYTSIPDESFYYTSFKVVNNLPSPIQGNSVQVVDESGNDVTYKFNTSISGQTVTFSLKNCNDSSFYGKSYEFRVNVNKKKGADVSSWASTGVPNSATISTDRGSKTSNTVYTKFTHNITSQVTNGTITESVTGIAAGSNKTYYYSPTNSVDYVLSKLVVDGVQLNGNTYPSSYAFSNINDDHSISVDYERVYKIETTVNNSDWGSVTDSIYKIFNGESRTINYSPKEGYYVKSVSVDGQSINLLDYQTSYSFSNISSDHKVNVVFAKKPTITISKSISNMSNVTLSKGSPTALFKIVGKDYLGRVQTFYRQIRFDDKSISEKSITVNIPAGNYSISEIPVNEYQLVAYSSNSVDTRNTDSVSVRYENAQSDYSEYTNNDLKVNNLK